MKLQNYTKSHFLQIYNYLQMRQKIKQTTENYHYINQRKILRESEVH